MTTVTEEAPGLLVPSVCEWCTELFTYRYSKGQRRKYCCDRHQWSALRARRTSGWRPAPVDRAELNYRWVMLWVDTSGGPKACHPWTGGGTAKGGYGIVRLDGEPQYVTRLLLGYLRGEPLGKDEEACHHCDNPPCCNWWHLFVGTQADNVADCWAKGRGAGFKTQELCRKELHRMTPDNVYVDGKTGARRCAECHRERQRAYEARTYSRGMISA